MNHFETSKETTRIAPEYRQYRKVEKTFKDKRFGFAENQLLEVPLNVFRIFCGQKALGADTHLSDITVRKLIEMLDSYENRPRMALAMRSAAVDIWKDAVEKSWAEDNLAAKTRAPIVVGIG